MQIQYAKFCSLVLQDVNRGIPVMPFDITPGVDGQTQVSYHFRPSVSLAVFGDDLGVLVRHHEDEDSRVVCAFTCSDERHAELPDLLDDAVGMGLAAWGGKPLSQAEALELARRLQPSREVTVPRDPDPETGEPTETTYLLGPVQLDEDGVLTRTRTEV